MTDGSGSPLRDGMTALLGELPRLCRPASRFEAAWHFVPELARRLQPILAADALAVLWLADDRRSFRVAADSAGATGPAAERQVREELAAARLRPALDGEAVVHADAVASGSAFERRRRAGGTQAWCAVPIERDGRPTGALVATRASADPFGGADLAAMRALAAGVAPFVESAMLLERLGDWDRRRRALLAMNTVLAGSLDLRKIFDDIVEAVRPIFGFDVMGVELMTPSTRTSERLVEFGGRGLLPRLRSVDDFSLSGALTAGQPALVHDVAAELDRARPGDRALLDAGIGSLLVVPLVFPLAFGERSRGVLYMAKRQPFWFDAMDVETAFGLAGPITLAIHHHRQVEQDRRIASAELRAEQLQQRLDVLKGELGARYGFERILGRSPPLRDTLERATRVAATETTVLITGESGTGKELVAHAIHLASPRADGPFLALNCAALPEALLESELFGHEKGAFTGAQKRKPGRFELAAGGTLFLDEVGELAPPVQAKLLRVLQQREYQTVGGTVTLRADVRLVAATNRDLAAEVGRGAFREDLLYRLNVFQLHLPPLRERGDDVLVLAEHFVRELEASMGKSVPGISQQARRTLLDYPWPGNIRELQNAIERAMILSDGGLIQAPQLGLDPAKLGGRATATPPGGAVGGALDGGQRLPDWERRLVVEALQKADGNKSRAAELLGVTRSQLYTRMKRFGL